MGSNKLLMATIGVGGIWTFAGYTYQIDSVVEINTEYIIEHSSLEHIIYNDVQYDSLYDIEIRYKSRTISQYYTMTNTNYYHKDGSTYYGAYGTYAYSNGAADILDTSNVEFVESGSGSLLDTQYILSDSSEYDYPGYSIVQTLVEYKSANGTWISLTSVGGYKVSDTTTTTTSEEKSITIESFGITEAQVAFGEHYHLILDIENVYDYAITMAIVDGVEYDLIYNGESINTNQYVLQFTNNTVNSSVVELLSTKTIEELYVNGNWLDIDDITAEHILRTIDNVGYEQEIEYLQNQIDSMNSALSTLSEEQRRAQENLVLINQQIANSVSTLESLKQERTKLLNDLNDIKTEYEKYESDLEIAKNELSLIKQQIESGEGDITQLQQTKSELIEEINSIGLELAQLDLDRQNSQIKLDSVNQEISSSTDQLNQLNAQLDDINTELANTEYKLTQTKILLDSYEAIRADKWAELEAYKEEKENLQKEIEALEQQRYEEKSWLSKTLDSVMSLPGKILSLITAPFRWAWNVITSLFDLLFGWI